MREEIGLLEVDNTCNHTHTHTHTHIYNNPSPFPSHSLVSHNPSQFAYDSMRLNKPIYSLSSLYKPILTFSLRMIVRASRNGIASDRERIFFLSYPSQSGQETHPVSRYTLQSEERRAKSDEREKREETRRERGDERRDERREER